MKSHYLRQLQTGIDFIEARLDTRIPLAQVARAAGMSQWHFQRIFKALTSETVKTYIRARRMAKALDRLTATDARIVDIALDAGFESQESFSRAFKKAFHMTPGSYRELGASSQFLKKLQLTQTYLEHMQSNISLTPELREQPIKTFVGLETHFFGPESEKNDIGEKLPPLWSAFMPRVIEIDQRVSGVCYGLVCATDHDSDRLQYNAAVEIADIGHVGHFGHVGFGATRCPPAMVRTELPAGTYAHFSHRGPPETIDLTVNYIYSTWLLQSGMRHTGQADLETYGVDYRPGSPDSIMLYGIPLS